MTFVVRPGQKRPYARRQPGAVSSSASPLGTCSWWNAAIPRPSRNVRSSLMQPPWVTRSVDPARERPRRAPPRARAAAVRPGSRRAGTGTSPGARGKRPTPSGSSPTIAANVRPCQAPRSVSARRGSSVSGRPWPSPSSVAQLLGGLAGAQQVAATMRLDAACRAVARPRSRAWARPVSFSGTSAQPWQRAGSQVPVGLAVAHDVKGGTRGGGDGRRRPASAAACGAGAQ